MTDIWQVGKTKIHLVRGDISNLDMEAFVFYARPDLKLGAGFGTAISVRGGPEIQKELESIGPKQVTEIVVTGGGNLKAQKIFHAVGPAFQEQNIEEKLTKTVLNVLQTAEKTGVTEIAFPPMGTGFYGIPLETSASQMAGQFRDFFSDNRSITAVVVCVQDAREFKPFHEQFSRAFETEKEAV